jgi:hypothetical protein
VSESSGPPAPLFESADSHNTTVESDEFGSSVEQPENAAFVQNQGAGKANSC